MDIESIREFCLSFEAASESFPFDDTTLVFKVGSKMFGLLSLDHPFSMSLKCDPQRAIELRERYTYVVEGYHLSKRHWNTINDIENVPSSFLQEMIQHSYDLVSRSLTKKEQAGIRGAV